MAQYYEPGAPGGVPVFSVPDSRIRWRAVFAGVLAGMIVQVLLSLLGLAIGLQAMDFASPNQNWMSFGIGSGIWLLISAVISAFSGGWVASALSNAGIRLDGALHGILSWGVFMVLTLYMLGAGLGSFVGGAFNLTANTLSGVVQQRGGIAAVREQVESTTQRLGTQQQEGQTPQEREQAANRAAGSTWATFAIALLSLAASAFGGVAGMKAMPIRRSMA
ncbi:MAG TPA: hypothetical protein V6C52_10315 [Coleofasciculaceae cyanobacterium]|jgi:hypothetical protein